MTEPLNLSELELTETQETLYDYEVKSWPWLFDALLTGEKKHDMRDKRDRPYAVGDVMLLREFDPRSGTYTGREARAVITYITDNVTPCAMSSAALDRNFAILSLDVIDDLPGQHA